MRLKNTVLIKKAINILLNVLIFIFGVILLISIYTSVQTRILGNNYANFFGYSIFEVQTGSMADAINPGDWVVVKLTQNVKLNDIITYESNGKYITHRIIEVYNGSYITKGDANSAKDEPTDQNQVVGKVVNIFASLGILRKTLFNPSVLIMLIITLFLFNLSIKKNKVEDAKNRSSKANKTENKHLFFDADDVTEKISSFLGKKQNSKNENKDKNVDESNVFSQFETNELEISENTYDDVDDDQPKIREYTEDELSKTSIYRVIPVDATEVEEKFKEVPTKVQVEEHYKDEDELDKTSLYRVIPVDLSEINDTLLEIAQNEIREAEQNDKSKVKVSDLEPKQEQETEDEEDENLTKINLEMLKNKKGKNIIDTAMIIKKEEINELINAIVKADENYINKETIKNIFMTNYIDARYHNYYGDKDIEPSGRNSISKIEKVIKNIASELVSDYKGNDKKYNDIVDLYARLFILVANLEKAKDSISDLKAKKEFNKKEIKKYSKDYDDREIDKLTDETIKIQKNYNSTLEYFLKNLETTMFNLKFNKLVSNKDMYGLELEHNIYFSKVYSEYIIDKTYTEGIIAEDKMSVTLTLLSVQLIKDINASNFNKKYILYIPNSLYAKEKKFEKILRMIEDKCAKDNIFILITFQDLSINKQFVKKVKKMGYKFALVFDKETAIAKKDSNNLYIADYIFVNKKAANKDNILSFIPEELFDKVIYDDIVNKVGDLGDE